MKPLGMKAYGSIPHLPGSRMGPGDHHIHPGQEKICLTKARPGDTIIVEEKLDGTCVAVAKINWEIVALTRSGYPALSSPYRQHHLFHEWVKEREHIFWVLLDEGKRFCGEWLAQAHGTRYDLKDLYSPFVIFDLMDGNKRATVAERNSKVGSFEIPWLVSSGPPIPIGEAMEKLGEYGHHNAIEPVEGVVYRVENNGKVDFLAKYVRPDKVDGKYLGEEIWNI